MKTTDSVLDRLRTYGDTIDAVPMPALKFGLVRQPKVTARKRAVGSGVALTAVCAVVAIGLNQRGTAPSSRVSGATAFLPALPAVPEGVDTWFPVDGNAVFVNTYGAERWVGTNDAHLHQGVDVFARHGQAVRAMRGGVVSRIGTARLAGNRLWLTEADGTAYYYAGFGTFAEGLRIGQKVEIGQLLGTLGGMPPGSSEAGGPPHLHLEIHPRGLGPVNPTPLLTALQQSNTPPDLGDSVNGIVVSLEATEPLRNLVDAAEADGIILSGGGYRSPAGQIVLRRKNCGATPFDVYVKPSSQCSPPTAKIDGSPHFRGIAVDFVVNAQGVKQGTTAHRWLVKNAGTFDFVGKPEEPWHWEYRPKRPTG